MSLRSRTTTKLRAAVAAFEFAEHRLREDVARWPSTDVDMTPHEVEEACARLAGIRAEIQIAIKQIDTTPRRRVFVNG